MDDIAIILMKHCCEFVSCKNAEDEKHVQFYSDSNQSSTNNSAENEINEERDNISENAMDVQNAPISNDLHNATAEKKLLVFPKINFADSFSQIEFTSHSSLSNLCTILLYGQLLTSMTKSAYATSSLRTFALNFWAIRGSTTNLLAAFMRVQRYYTFYPLI